MMESEVYLKSIGLPKLIEEIHLAITEKFPNKEAGFDAWYTNKMQAVGRIENLGQCLARKIKGDFRFPWVKLMPDGNALPDWAISPDGELLGLSILLAGWVASQFSAKLKDIPNKEAQSLLDNYPSIINAAIIIGKEIGQG